MIGLTFDYELAEPTACMQSAVPSASFKFEIADIKLILPRVHVHSDLLLTLERRLQTSPASYTYYHTSAREFIIPTNTTHWREEGNCLKINYMSICLRIGRYAL